MVNINKESVPPYYNRISAKKIALSLIRGAHENYTDADSPVTQVQYYGEELEEQSQANAEAKLSTIRKFEKEINELNQKIEENNTALGQIESYIIDLNKLKAENTTGQSKPELLYSVFEDSLLKRVIIRVNGSDVEGVLSELTPEYIKLVASEYLVVIPIDKIDFIRLSF